MLILALESSGDIASCALWCDGEVIERRCPPGEPSSATLLPTVRALLADAGVGLDSLTALAFGAGPGSFTGLRVACGLAQGLAFPHGIPLVPVSTLAAMAMASGDSRVMAVLDARMQEVYYAPYRVEAGELIAEGAAGVAPPAAVPQLPEGWSACGNAITAYPELRDRLAGAKALRADIAPTAAAVAVLGARSFAAGGAIAAADAAPVYVRDRVALTVAERLATGGKA